MSLMFIAIHLHIFTYLVIMNFLHYFKAVHETPRMSVHSKAICLNREQQNDKATANKFFCANDILFISFLLDKENFTSTFSIQRS